MARRLSAPPMLYRIADRFPPGCAWKKSILLVPSVVHEGLNAIVTPAHPDAARLTISRPRQVRWDKRLFAEES